MFSKNTFVFDAIVSNIINFVLFVKKIQFGIRRVYNYLM